jgi:hypothetical protein
MRTSFTWTPFVVGGDSVAANCSLYDDECFSLDIVSAKCVWNINNYGFTCSGT